MKNSILKILYRARGETRSGVYISRALNISRVAVWKHIQRMKTEGWQIESSPNGYRLANFHDLLHPLCFQQREKLIHHHFQTSSTMDIAKTKAREGAPHFSVIVAEQQTRGRGRLNRQWRSSQGGLWFTIVLRPALPPPLVFKLNFAASLSLAWTLNNRHHIGATVKWPNDIMVNGKKVAGILSEMETEGDMVAFVNIGIGLNVNNTPESDEPAAASLKGILGTTVSRQRILSHFLDAFENQVMHINDTDIVSRWKKTTSTIGNRVTIETQNGVFEGIAKDVDDSGALIVKKRDGSTQRVIYGDCFYKETSPL